MRCEINDSVIDCARLAYTEKVSRPPEAEIGFGNLKAVFSPPQGFKALLGQIPQRGAVQQDTVRFLLPASDASSPLVELREAKSFRALNDDYCCVRDIHANFDDCRGDQNTCLTRPELFQSQVLVFAAHAAVHETDRNVELFLQHPGPLNGGGIVVVCIDTWANPENAFVASTCTAHSVDNFIDTSV